MKLGIIGAGSIVAVFLPQLLNTDGIQVLSIFARRIEAAKILREQYQLAFSTDSFETFCSSGIDTAYVAVSNIAHYEYCRKALEAGLHVIVEKPFTANVSEAEELLRLAKEKQLFLFEAITTIHMPVFHQIRQWLPLIGDIRNVECMYTQRSRRYDDFCSGIILPAFDPKHAGGALMDLNVYNLHYVIGLFGKPDSAKYYPTIQNNIDTSGRLILNYPGFTANCYAAKDCSGISGSIIQGTMGFITTAGTPNKMQSAKLHLASHIEEYIDPHYSTRASTEFRIFNGAMQNKNYLFCYQLLENSITASQVMTNARLDNNIHFPCD